MADARSLRARPGPRKAARALTAGSEDGRAAELASADEAGLRYATDREPGISRRRRGTGFEYRHADGRLVDTSTLDRIRGLVIPPAWTHVWIAPDARAHLQASGR